VWNCDPCPPVAGPHQRLPEALPRRRGRHRHLQVELRNVAFDSHRDALAARGGAATPALWDGERLHEGLAAIRAALLAARR
jgi:hypothetical protein